MDVNFSKAAGADKNSGTLSGGGIHASGAGSSDGGPLGPAGGGGLDGRPRFDEAVPKDGYRWWYVDALSDDGRHGLTVIGFVGSVFSPYYFSARKRGPTDPMNHCAINVALYGRCKRWAMTERGGSHVSRDATTLTVGPSSMRWAEDALVIQIDERSSPLPRRLRGEIRLRAAALHSTPVLLSGNGLHLWQAVAPEARVEVSFSAPHLQWSGQAYHDMNWGDEPLERGFQEWNWARAKTQTGTRVIYDATLQNGSQKTFGIEFSGDHQYNCAVPDLSELPKAFWRMKRPVRSEKQPHLISTLEDAPFYTRNHLALQLDGAPCEAVHESLSLDRFVHPLTQWMLPFKMPRRA
jgi:carotenoid 1,2-hydratase